MRKLLNTLYVTDENAYLSLEGETVICKSDGKDPLRIPFVNIENIVCFNYMGCSPALMGKCADCGIPISFFKPSGRFLARITGRVQGSVYTRISQMDAFQRNKITLIQNSIAAKLSNTRYLVDRICRDHPEFESADKIRTFSEDLKAQINAVYETNDEEVIRGIEGNCAKQYFSIFDKLILNDEYFKMTERSKHPPLDATNALLSFMYSLMTNEISSALESVGLDSYIGFFHTPRAGRPSLACDLVEEVRVLVDRMVIHMINLKMVSESDFEKQVSGAVYLNDSGRKKVLKYWQERKRDSFMHSELKEKIPYGLLTFVQANLLAKFVRGEIEEYPPFLMR
ncbi:MAG: type I-C CRISPR-associated endonuclease Cas1c [Bacteroidales bacterium]|nr:type I-C CRISPR-associated endonuclease Cas1c [Bacteroidales bacterium]